MHNHTTLDFSAAVGRYAVAYVRNVCAQAHLGFIETSAGEDVLAVDGVLQYPYVDVRVQIKGSTGPSLTKQAGQLAFAIDDKWREKWARNGPPTYFIYVLMEHDVVQWFDYQPTATTAGAYALWARVDNLSQDATHVHFDRTHRFTTATVGAWYQDVFEGFGGGSASA